MATRTFPTRIDIRPDSREKLIVVLNQHLADASDLHSQTKQAHWNIKGKDFIALHELFDTFAANLTVHVDTIAERVTALGGMAQGTARMAAANSRLPEFPDIVESMAIVAALADRYAAFGATVRQGIDQATEYGDMDTADLFTEVSRDIDKHLWFLEAHLQA